MHNVLMDKGTLLGIVAENRDKHRQLFEEALEAFREKAIENLEARIRQIRDGGKIDLYLDLQQPEDHTEDYDRVIEMLQYEVENEVKLSNTEFAQYVQDNWGWKTAFTQTYVSNTGKNLV